MSSARLSERASNCVRPVEILIAMESPNTLLYLLHPEERAAIITAAEQIALSPGSILHDFEKPIQHVYFLQSGLCSKVALDLSGRKTEVGCIGREGFVGIPAVLGVDASPHRSCMETTGTALRIRIGDLIMLIDAYPSVKSAMLRFAHVFMVQIASTALANSRYNVVQRTARWMLMSHDRAEGDELPLTHEFLSIMLGVRRSSITAAIHTLEGELAVRADRRLITVRDRDKLEELSGGSYGQAEAEYERVLGMAVSKAARTSPMRRRNAPFAGG